ncbi:Na+/H+ antiporter [Methylobacterium oxalidis]|uniref:Na+:H+ antiporter n=2 Tax=Methylobacterium TaxID=407 RepID=A0A512JDA8_9HYPH|nr:Na+/H+ antiporter [Methylobacterium oxalidis]GEP07944.1 Na+:H+ antiporter [Methylobacterium oxalidis]GJE35748.1 Sodium, potassium, lithium and rubidium/H(+) antiporter [Methylobacterium oxalidis]GLS62410.1 Na+:H+ antiporter [Methylobacterium oxalidis]
METVTIVLALLLAVLVSGALGRLLPLPLPLIQIVIGVALALGPLPSTSLDPEIFFLVFLPPLLFLDGWRIPKRDLFRDGKTVLALALGLVALTVLGIGILIHWIIPSMPLAIAFALAAVLSPTDPIAVSSVAAQAPVPRRLMHILEGEALLNDATGLVCLRFAIAAALTGSFSLPEAATTFLWLAIAGLGIGAATTFLLTGIQELLRRRTGEDPGLQILLSLLTPFGAYLAAEHVHASGILAAVAAGIAMTYVEIQGRSLGATRVRRTAVWDSVALAANGAIFVLLGEQLPDVFRNAVKQADVQGAGWIVAWILVITAGLMAVRFVWVSVSLQFVLMRARSRGEKRDAMAWRLVAATTLAGVKGAITLAGILTLPLTLTDGSPFPARDLAILLAMGVILTSLLLASTVLPPLLRGLQLPPEPSHDAEEDAARAAARDDAVKAIEALQHRLVEEYEDASIAVEAGARAMDRYEGVKAATAERQAEATRFQQLAAMEKRLRLAGIEAERSALYRMRRSQVIDDVVLRRLVREVDLIEARLVA